MTEEVFLTGRLEDETDRYYHIYFFGTQGADHDSLDNYVFVPKSVCRIAGPRTVAIQDWYVKKHNLTRFTQQSRREKIQVDMDKIRLQQALRAMRRARGE
jgi:hypothetical protein